MRKFIRIGSKGDTIIEILLAITVLSLVLSVSYGLANRSTQAIRQAQERSEAQKLAEEQLELLREYFSPDQPWESLCFNAAGNPTSSNADCTNRGSGNRYNLQVVQSGENTFTVDMEWPNIRGGTDELTLSYKLPVTGDIPDMPHTECSDDIDNNGDGYKDANDPDCWLVAGNPGSYDPTIDQEDPPPPPKQCEDGVDNDGDGDIDFPDDYSCSGPNDDNELHPVPPTLTIAGSSHTSCDPGGRADYCQIAGSSVYSLSTTHPSNSNPAFSTRYKFNGLPAGNYDLVIRYFNYSVAGLYPAGNYKFKVTISYPGGTKNVELPIERTSASQDVRSSDPITLNITSSNPTITIKWNNDFCSCYSDSNPGGGDHDSNFGISSVRLRGT